MDIFGYFAHFNCKILKKIQFLTTQIWSKIKFARLKNWPKSKFVQFQRSKNLKNQSFAPSNFDEMTILMILNLRNLMYQNLGP